MLTATRQRWHSQIYPSELKPVWLRWYTRQKTVTHPSTNRARRRVTSLMLRTTLPPTCLAGALSKLCHPLCNTALNQQIDWRYAALPLVYGCCWWCLAGGVSLAQQKYFLGDSVRRADWRHCSLYRVAKCRRVCVNEIWTVKLFRMRTSQLVSNHKCKPLQRDLRDALHQGAFTSH